MEDDMKHMLLAIPLAGAIMSPAVAFAQTNTATPVQQETPAAPSGQTEAPSAVAPPPDAAARTDCVDLGTKPAGETEDLAESLDNSAQATDNNSGMGEVSAADGPSASETPPVEGADSGTSPGGAGSSGWTGGLGGSDIGTSQAEPVETSPQQDHPALAKGLDPISGETAVEGPQAPPPPMAPSPAASSEC